MKATIIVLPSKITFCVFLVRNRFKAQSIVMKLRTNTFIQITLGLGCAGYSKISTSIPKMHTSRLKKTNGSNTTFIYLRPACPLNHSNRNGLHVKGTCIRPWLYQFVDRR